MRPYRRLFIGLSLLWASMIPFQVIAGEPIQPTLVFTVNSTADTDDGACDQTSCTLREAINSANASTGKDTIQFMIAGTGTKTISPMSALPVITDSVIINGSTQPGFAGTPLIQIDGTNAGNNTSGLTISAGQSEVQALIINNFSDRGIRVTGLGGNRFVGNYLGTDATGSVARPNYGGIIILDSPDHIIGGPTAADRNVISGNNFDGITLQGGGTSNVQVLNNYIGVTVFGTTPLGNGTGITIGDAPNNIIGAPGMGNIISANSAEGMFVVLDGATGNMIQSNYIGTDTSGTNNLGNGFFGLHVTGTFSNTIGGMDPAEGNVIAYNNNDGVYVYNGDGNAVWNNQIYANEGLGIDLDQTGVTPNDLGDPDFGSNMIQNFPVLTAVTSGNGNTAITGTLNTISNTTFLIQLYSNDACDVSQHGEGQVVLGQLAVTTDDNGDAAFALAFPRALAVGSAVSAIAMDPDNNTSEFSECASVVEACTLFGNVNNSGGVDLADLVLMAENWQEMTPAYDLDGSGAVTMSDIMLVAARFGQSCP